MTQTKKRTPKAASKKSLEAKANKALARAEKSVRKARKAVKHSSKKLRAKAAELAKTTGKLETKHSESTSELRAAKAVATTTKPSAAFLRPPLPTPEPAAPTLVELRHRAKDQGIAGYSRLNKAALIAALDSETSE